MSYCIYMYCALVNLILQEKYQQVFVELQLLPNMDQFCVACPQAHAGLYYDLNSVVIHCVSEVAIDDLLAIASPPNVILKWDPNTDTFCQISTQVHKADAQMYDTILENGLCMYSTMLLLPAENLM